MAALSQLVRKLTPTILFQHCRNHIVKCTRISACDFGGDYAGFDFLILLLYVKIFFTPVAISTKCSLSGGLSASVEKSTLKSVTLE